MNRREALQAGIAAVLFRSTPQVAVPVGYTVDALGNRFVYWQMMAQGMMTRNQVRLLEGYRAIIP